MSNPKHFESISCQKCGSTHELQRHRYSDEIQCVHCVNDELATIAKQANEREGYYYELSYNQLCEERNL